MATLAFNGSTANVLFTPISSALANLPNGAGTIAALVRIADGVDAQICELLNAAESAWYHGVGIGTYNNDNEMSDDDGLTGPVFATSLSGDAAGAGNYRIVGLDWPTGAAALERAHVSSVIGGAETWTHLNSGGNNGGTRAGPATTGHLKIGMSDASNYPFAGEIALLAVWAGVRFSDTDWTNLWTNKKTSDWYNHSAGTPTTLIELTSTSPVDVGANPSTLSAVTAATATGADPTGWTFDGQGVTAVQQLRPDADTVVTGWTPSAGGNVYAVVNDESDATYASATLA